MTEREAHDEILRRCRIKGCEWVMRTAPTDPMPGYEWSSAFRVIDGTAWVKNRIVSEGDSWLEVLSNLPDKFY